MENQWKKPELVIVTRGNAEENVLSGCKLMGNSGSSNLNNGCLVAGDRPCVACIVNCCS